MHTKRCIFFTLLFLLFFQTVPISKALAKAKAGPDQKVDEGDTVILDGSASELKHGIDSYQWEQTGGSPTVILVDADKAKASFTAPDVGAAETSLKFKLTVSNNFGDSDTDTTKVTVRPANQPPTANFSFTTSDLSVNLDASSSSDPDGTITSYSWNFGDGNSGSGKITSYTYAAAGTYSVQLTVTDNDGASDTISKKVSVSAPNQPPTANFSFTTSDLSVNLDASSSSDPDGTITSYSWNFGDGNSGSGKITSYTYAAAGTYSVQLTVTDNDGASDTISKKVSVSAPNQPPTANDDFYNTIEDIPLTLAPPGVLGNDSDPDGDPLTAVKVNNPTNGTVTLNSNGGITYAPNTNFNGIDSFTYMANDGSASSNVATVTITVGAINDPPTAINDSYSTSEDKPLTVAAPGVLGNDTDPDDDALRAFLQAAPRNGTLSLKPDGSFSYEPNLNFNGTDFFAYMANDGTSNSNVATVTITVKPVVDPPIADAGPDQTVDEKTTVTLGGSNSFDAEGEKLSYQWDQIAGPSVTLSDTKGANPTFRAPVVGGPGGESLTFSLTVTDEEGAQAIDTVILNVTLPLANRPPTADAGPDLEVDQETKVVLDGSNSFDPDGDNLSYQWNQLAGPSVTLSDPAAVKPTFEGPFVDSDGLSYTFELTVTDSSGLKATDTIVINVTLPFGNKPPIAVVGDDQTVDENSTVTLDGSQSSDHEGNLFYRWRQVAGRPVTLSDPSVDQPTFTTPNVGAVGVSLVFELTVTDFFGLRAVADTFVNVAGDNDFPIADAGDDQTVDENTSVTLDGFGSFDPEGENLSYSWRQIAGPSVTLSDPGYEKPTFTAQNVTPNGVLLNFELTVTDPFGLQERDDVGVRVFGNNDVPTADAGDDQTVLEKSTVTLDGSSSSDPDIDDSMTYQWEQTGGTAVTLSDRKSRRPTFQAPSFNDAGGQPLNFELIITDGEGAKSTDSTTVSVSNFEKNNPGASGGGCFIETAAYGFRWAK